MSLIDSGRLFHAVGPATEKALESCTWYVIQSHRSWTQVGTCYLYYILTLHRVSFALPPSISSPNLVSTLLLLPLVVFDMPAILALLFGIPSLIIWDLSTLIHPSSNPILKLTCALVQAFLAPNNSIYALLIRQQNSQTAYRFEVFYCLIALYSAYSHSYNTRFVLFGLWRWSV